MPIPASAPSQPDAGGAPEADAGAEPRSAVSAGDTGAAAGRGPRGAAAGRGPLGAAGIGPWWFLGLLAVAWLVHGRDLSGPFPDGQDGNCGAMFALFAQNSEAYGWLRGGLVPVLDPAPATDGVPRVRYTHHPPGLPWLVMAAGRLPLSLESAARLVALLLTALGAWLAADLAARLLSRRAAAAAGLLFLLLPAGLLHGLLVNYETAALPPLLYVTRVLLLERGKAALGAAWAALSDWVALLPVLLVSRRVCRARWWRSLGTAALVTTGVSLLARGHAPGSVAETVHQGLGATFLSPAFDGSAWVASLARFAWDLYGLALVPALLAPFVLRRRDALLRRTLFVLLAVGAANVVLFAHHATSHEHFSLLLLPYVVLATAAMTCPGTQASRGAVRLGGAALVLVLGVGAVRTLPLLEARGATHQAAAADAFSAVAPSGVVYLRPTGASLVFLQRARRHVVPFPFADLPRARILADEHRRRFGVAAPAEIVVEADRPTPAWLLPLGEGRTRGAFRFLDLAP